MHKKSVVPVVAALAAFLSVSTMLRFPGLPVGLGEAIVLLASFGIIRRRGFLKNLKHPLMLFWASFIATAIVGYFMGSVRGVGSIHTGVAYLYAAGFTLIVLAYVDELNKAEFQRFIRAMGTIPTLLLSVPLLIFFSGSIWFSDLLEINTSFYPSRVAAWSTNPNQLALFLLPVPIWLAAISQNTNWSGWRLIRKFFFLWFFFFLGFSVRSDALLLAWCIGIPLLTVMTWSWLKKINWKFFATLISSFLLAFVSFKFFIDGPGQQVFEAVRTEISQEISSVSRLAVTDDGGKFVSGGHPSKAETVGNLDHASASHRDESKDQGVAMQKTPVPLAFGRSDSAIGIGMDPNKGGVRKTLWVHAFEVWKLSPIFGHGPGGFSYLDTPSERQEAHNLLLDMLTQVGIAGVLLFAALYLWLIIGAIKARDPYSMTLLVVLMIFSGAHFMLRQPVFALYMVICAVVVKNRLFEQLDDDSGNAQVTRPALRI